MTRTSRELLGYGAAVVGIMMMMVDFVLTGGTLHVAGMSGLAILFIGAVVANC